MPTTLRLITRDQNLNFHLPNVHVNNQTGQAITFVRDGGEQINVPVHNEYNLWLDGGLFRCVHYNNTNYYLPVLGPEPAQGAQVTVTAAEGQIHLTW